MKISCRPYSAVVAGSMALILSVSPSFARSWKTNPISLAQDYLTIIDNRGGGDQAIVMWLSSALLPDSPQTQSARELLDKTVVIGVVRGKAEKDGTLKFISDPPVVAKGADGKSLRVVSKDETSPAMLGALATIQVMLGRAMGPFGQGIKWVTFDAGALKPCGKGVLAVEFADETYTFETPLPGCK